MSSYYRILRERWAYPTLILREWLKGVGDRFEAGEVICTVDNGEQTLPIHGPDEPGYILSYLSSLGCEVELYGELFEWSAYGPYLRVQPPVPLLPNPVGTVDKPKYPLMISYRRVDTEGFAGRLHERLIDVFGDKSVFLDQFSIPGGTCWEESVRYASSTCKVMLVLVGRKWATLKDRNGRRRIDSEFDLVRREVVAALDRRIRVMPVVVQDARLPRQTALPDEMSKLLKYQAVYLTTRNWKHDVDYIIQQLQAATE